jgi:hypothetical protein
MSFKKIVKACKACSIIVKLFALAEDASFVEERSKVAFASTVEPTMQIQKASIELSLARLGGAPKTPQVTIAAMCAVDFVVLTSSEMFE